MNAQQRRRHRRYWNRQLPPQPWPAVLTVDPAAADVVHAFARDGSMVRIRFRLPFVNATDRPLYVAFGADRS